MTCRSTATISRAALALVVLASAFGVACNWIDSLPDVDGDADAAASSESKASRPTDSDLTSLGAGADTRIYYQYVDERGGVRFAERLDDVPEAWRDRVGYVELDSPPPMSPADAKRTRNERYARANPGSNTPASASSGATGGRAMDRFEPEILLYYADWCGYCKKAKRHLDRAGVDYVLRDVDNPHIKRELIEKTGQKGIPVIEVDGRIMKGYSAAALDELIDSV